MPEVVIDAFPSSAKKYVDSHAIVVVDVIRFTTTVATALSVGRKVYPARTSDEAWSIAETLHYPLLAGELGGNVPYGFDMSNSPVQVAALRQVPCGKFSSPTRPIVLISSSGSQLLMEAAGASNVYLGCLRNITALVSYIADRHDRIAVIGAGTRGQFRREDQLCCAWIARRLVETGFEPANDETADLIEKWHGENTEVIREGGSAQYLRRSGQVHDLEFVLHYQEDLQVVPRLKNGSVLIDAIAPNGDEPA